MSKEKLRQEVTFNYLFSFFSPSLPLCSPSFYFTVNFSHWDSSDFPFLLTMYGMKREMSRMKWKWFLSSFDVNVNSIKFYHNSIPVLPKNPNLIPIYSQYPTSDGARDLLEKIFVYDPEVRLTAEQAIAHQYVSRYRDAADEVGYNMWYIGKLV